MLGAELRTILGNLDLRDVDHHDTLSFLVLVLNQVSAVPMYLDLLV